MLQHKEGDAQQLFIYFYLFVLDDVAGLFCFVARIGAKHDLTQSRIKLKTGGRQTGEIMTFFGPIHLKKKNLFFSLVLAHFC